MSGKQWLTINDWMESCLPLCPITIRNDGSLNDVEPQCLRICFSSPKIGGSVLGDGISQVDKKNLGFNFVKFNTNNLNLPSRKAWNSALFQS